MICGGAGESVAVQDTYEAAHLVSDKVALEWYNDRINGVL